MAHKKTNSVAFRPQENYTDRHAKLVQLLRVESVAWSMQQIPMAINLSFIDQSRYFLIQAAHQLSSQG
jgi:hypothetical protein